MLSEHLLRTPKISCSYQVKYTYLVEEKTAQ